MKKILTKLLSVILVVTMFSSVLPLKLNVNAVSHSHPVCGNSCTCGGSHTAASWTALSAGTMTLSSGHYYLENNISFSGLDELTITGDVSLCLNGKKITREDGNGCISVKDNGSLNLCDCTGTGVISDTSTTSGSGTIYLTGNGSLSVYSGTIKGASFPAVACSTTGNLKIYGGTITSNGTAVRVYKVNDISVSAGTITSANDSGIGFKYSTFNNLDISGGYIEGNLNGVLFESYTCTGRVLISGGTLYGKGPVPNATTYMANYYGLAFMREDSNACNVTISGGSLDGARGGFYNQCPLVNLTVSGGVLGSSSVTKTTRGIASYGQYVQINGGKVYSAQFNGPTNVTMTDGEILSTGFYNSKGNVVFKMYGGTLGQVGSKTSSTGIFIPGISPTPTYSGSLYIYGGNIIGTNYAIHMYGAFDLQLSGGTLSGDVADIYLINPTTILSDTLISLKDYNGETLTVKAYPDEVGSYLAKNVSQDGLISLVSDINTAEYDAQKKAVIISHTHSYSSVVTKPTCTNQGYTTYTCKCGDSYKSDYVSENGHKFSTEWTVDSNPTCIRDGSKSHHCTVCNSKTDVTVIPALGHSYSTEWTVDVEPTCTEDGSKSHHCTVCNSKTDVTVLPALGHNYSTDWTIDVEPTCTENGSKSRHCTVCGDKTDITDIDSFGGHDYSNEWTIDVEPTCTENGSKSRHCTVCGDKTDITIIEYLGHYFENDICIRCDKFFADALTPVVKSGVLESAHNYASNTNQTKVFTAPAADYIEVKFSSSTEVENNYDKIYIYDGSDSLVGTFTGTALKNQTITVNGDTVKIKLTSDSVVNKYGYYATCTGYRTTLTCDNHLHKKVVNKVEPGCESTGYSGDVYCIVCKELVEESKEVPAKGHSCSEWVIDKESTCTEEGSKHGTCSVCGESVTEVIPANGHSCSEWVTDTLPTCTQTGSKHGTCSVCRNVVTEEISATGHQNTMWVTEQEPACETAGRKDEWCLDCGEIIATEEIPATGHQNTSWVTEQDPACETAGRKDEWCLDCGEIIATGEIPATGHQHTKWVTDLEPTCDAVGCKNEYCLDCGVVVNSEVISSTGHSYSDWRVSVEPTCTEDGAKQKECSSCGDVVTETVSSTGHNYSDEWTIDIEPNCTEEGSKSHHCIVCGDKADVTVVSSLGHKYSDEWTVDVAPTCKENGSKSHHCTVCDNDVADITVIEPLGHDYIVGKIAEEHPHPTAYKCSRCPDTKTEDTYSPKCITCNFLYTDIDDETCKITGYIGSATSFVMPSEINGKAVTSTATGAFKNNTTLTSVEIENGVQELAALSFLGCKSLSKIVIPESVTKIGENAFYNCASDFTIYCYYNSCAMQYAIDKSLNYVVLGIGETENTTIDHINKLIFTTQTCSSDINNILSIPSTSVVSVEASYVCGEYEFLGTGSMVTVVDNDGNSYTYTLVVDGDTNGDSVCDVLDCVAVERATGGREELVGAYALAADTNSDDVIDVNDYQAIINKAV